MAISGVNGGPAYYSAYISSRAALEAGCNNGNRAQTLDGVKQEMADAVSAIRERFPQTSAKKFVCISEQAYEKMLRDPEYKAQVLNKIERDLSGADSEGYSLSSIGIDGEYRANNRCADFAGISPEGFLDALASSGAESAQTLDDFKWEMYDIIDKMPVHPSQSGTQISINISDKAFEKMMNDPAYKDLMLKTIQRDLGGAYPAGAAPSYSVIRIGDDCEYKADAMGAAFGAGFSAAKANGFLEKNTNRASSNYDEYNGRKERIDKRRVEKQAEERLLEKRLFEKRAMARELQEQQLARTDRTRYAAEAYDKAQM